MNDYFSLMLRVQHRSAGSLGSLSVTERQREGGFIWTHVSHNSTVVRRGHVAQELTRKAHYRSDPDT